MSKQSTKRQRANTDGDSTTGWSSANAKFDYYESIIEKWDEQTVREVLLVVVSHYPDAGTLIVRRQNCIRRDESAKVIDFDFQSKVAWHALNNPRDKRNGSRGYEAGIDAAMTVSQIIATIREQTPTHASFGTKKSALVTLRKIGKSIALGGRHDEFGSQVIKTLNNQNNHLEAAMLEIVGAMTEEEKAKMHADKEWIEKVEELMEHGEDIDMFETLRTMLELLDPDERQTTDSSVVSSTSEESDGKDLEESVQRGVR